jgi:hypothetical protein
MGVTGEAPASATGRLLFELKTNGQNEGEDIFEERLAIAKTLEVRRFAPEIDGDGAVLSCRFCCCAQVSPPCPQVLVS